MVSSKKPLTKEQILAAAVRCLERHGVAKTSVVDIAAELGVTRQTVHRLFETKGDLLSAVADLRIAKLATRLQQAFRQFDDLGEALVHGSLLSLEVGSSDPIIADIQAKADHTVDRYMFRGSATVQAVMVSVWGPLIDKAREQGQLRSGLSNDEIVEWIRNVHAMLTLREDYGPAEREAMLRSFLVPSILAS